MGEGIYQQAGDGAIQIGRARDVYIDTRRPLVGVPFQAPAVPRYFVPRPEVSQALMDYLTADAPPGALVVSAVHGLGGIGKTTLVAALAHTPDVQARFSDGVLWATLGQQPDILSLLAGWIQALGDYDFHPTVVESASAHLRSLLHDKACLLVVDDAWQADYARPFLVGGPRCRLVVTTRNAVLARKVGARLYDLDVMTEAQALALFQARLGPLDGDREQAAALARELGYLPLALELAAAQVEAGLSWTELLDAFRQAQADLAVLDLDEATYRNESLRLSFRLSLEQLSPDDRDAFAWLGVLPEDVSLNPAMAATLWDQPEASARKRLRRLRDRALLKSIGGERYTLHDLLHDEAKLRLAERMPLPEAQAVLLARYRQKAPDAQWHRLPDDGYIHEHLTWHMEQAGQPETVHALLCLETQEGRNAWYEARERLGQTAGYLDDVRRAWRFADEALSLKDGRTVGWGIRYALITASLNSLAKNIPPALVVALVKHRVWTPSQGLTYACQVPRLQQRAEVLCGLAPHLPRPLLQEALAAVLGIRNAGERAKALARLASHLPEPLKGEAMREMRKTPPILRLLPGPLLTIWQVRELMWPIAVLVMPLFVVLVSCCGSLVRRRILRVGFIETLTESIIIAMYVGILVAALRVKIFWGVLARLILFLPEPLKERSLRKALAAVQAIRDEIYRAKALAGLAPHLSMPLRKQVMQGALEAVHKIQSVTTRAKVLGVLGELALHIPNELLREALAAAHQIQDTMAQAETLTKLSAYLPELSKDEAMQKVLSTVWRIRDEYWRVKMLADLVPELSKSLREQVVREALAVVREMGNKRDRDRALSELVSRLAELGRFREALATACAIEHSHWRAEALLRLPSDMPARLLLKALVKARMIPDKGDQIRVVSGLAPHLPDPLRDQTLRDALAMAQTIQDKGGRILALARLAPHLPEPQRKRILRHAAWEAAGMGIEDERVEAFSLTLAAALFAESGDPRMALRATRWILNEKWKAHALLNSAPYLPQDFLQKALAMARKIKNKRYQARALSGLVPWLPTPLQKQVVQEALSAADEIGDRRYQAEVASGLAPHLSVTEQEQVVREQLTVLRDIEWEPLQASTLFRFTSQLAESSDPERLLAAARGIEVQRERRADALRALTSNLVQLPEATLSSLWTETLHDLARRTRAELLSDLSALSPVIAALGREEATAETFRAIQDVGRWWP